MGIIEDSGTDRRILTEFEKYKVSYEAAIEECCYELEENKFILANIIYYYRGEIIEIKGGTITGTWNKVVKFSESPKGRVIADQYIDKIRSCSDWEELYDELHSKSTFSKHLIKQIQETMGREMPDTCGMHVLGKT